MHVGEERNTPKKSFYLTYCTLCCFSYINQRNRDRNIKETENALRRENEENKGAKADPFTRRNCIPTLVTKLHDPDQKAVIRQRVEDQYAMELPEDADLLKVITS